MFFIAYDPLAIGSLDRCLVNLHKVLTNVCVEKGIECIGHRVTHYPKDKHKKRWYDLTNFWS